MAEPNPSSSWRAQKRGSDDDDAAKATTLRLRVRPRTTSSSLFVRLSPRAARELYSIVSSSSAAAVVAEDEDVAGWTVRSHGLGVLDGDCPSGVEFLPLEISATVPSSSVSATEPSEEAAEGEDDRLGGSKEKKRVVYASYNGGDAAEEEGEYEYGGDDDNEVDVIEMHPTLLDALSSSPSPSTSPGALSAAAAASSSSSSFDAPVAPPASSYPAFVNVRPLPCVSDASSIVLEPLTSDDWEALEFRSDALEGGGMLSQVSVVYPGQVLRLDLAEKGKAGEWEEEEEEEGAWVRVTEDGFAAVGDDDDETTGAAAPGRTEGSSGGSGALGKDDDPSGLPGDEDFGGDDDSWWSYDTDASDDESEGPLSVQAQARRGHKCLRLVADTEVIVVPKARPKPVEEEEEELCDPSAPLRVHPSISDFAPNFLSSVDELSSAIGAARTTTADASGKRSSATAAAKAAAEARAKAAPTPPVGPPPHVVHVHPRTLEELVPGWERCCRRRRSGFDFNENGGGDGKNDGAVAVLDKVPRLASFSGGQRQRTSDEDDEEEEERKTSDGHDCNSNDDDIAQGVAEVLPSSDVPYGHIVLHRHLRYQLELDPLFDSVLLRLVPPARAEAEAGRTEEGIRNGSLRAELVPTDLVSSSSLVPFGGDGGDAMGRTWRLPRGYHGGAHSTGSLDAGLKWSDDGGALAPIASGCLVSASSLPDRQPKGSESTEKTDAGMYTVIIRDVSAGSDDEGATTSEETDDDKVERPPPMERRIDDAAMMSGIVPRFVFRNDLPSLLERFDYDATTHGRNGTIQKEDDSARRRRSLSAPPAEAFLNLAPTSTVLSDGFRRALSDVQYHVDLVLSASSSSYSLPTTEEGPFGQWRSTATMCPDGLLISGEEGSGRTHLMLCAAAVRRVHGGGTRNGGSGAGRNGAPPCATVYLDCSHLRTSPSATMRTVLDELTSAFRDAKSGAPSIILLDGLDALVPNTEDESGEDEDGSIQHARTNPAVFGQVKLLADHVRALMEDAATATAGGVVVMASCTGATSVAPSLRRTGLFSSLVEVPNLDTTESRAELFDEMVGRALDSSSSSSSSSVSKVSVISVLPSFGKLTEGYRPRDFEALASRVAKRWYVRSLGRGEGGGVDGDGGGGEEDEEEAGSADASARVHRTEKTQKEVLSSSSSFPIPRRDLESVLGSYVPVAHRGLRIEDEGFESSAPWSAVGGLFRAKRDLTDVVLHPVRYSLIYRNAPVSLPRGVLLYGPPGCGKTFLVPALARELNFRLVACRGPELLDRYIGASEANVRRLFARAYAAAPSILFLDDFDALAPRRGTDHTGVTDRVVNQLLTFLDGVEEHGKSKGMVYIVAATSRPDKIDPALLRPGRLEKHIYLGYPTDRAEWTDVFSAVSSRGKTTNLVEESVRESIASGALLDECTAEDEGGRFRHVTSFSAADMKAVLDTAYLEAVHEHLAVASSSSRSSSDDDEGKQLASAEAPPPTIRRTHLLRALENTRPSLLPSDRGLLRRIYDPFYRRSSPDGSSEDDVPLGDFDDEDEGGSAGNDAAVARKSDGGLCASRRQQQSAVGSKTTLR